VEKIGQHGRCGRGADQTFDLESLDRCRSQIFAFSIEIIAPGASLAIGDQSLFEALCLQERCQTRQRALGDRGRCQRIERRPEMILVGRIERNAFRSKKSSNPLRSPASFSRLVDPSQWLKCNPWAGVLTCIDLAP
jgi:hypothetical protein